MFSFPRSRYKYTKLLITYLHALLGFLLFRGKVRSKLIKRTATACTIDTKKTWIRYLFLSRPASAR